MHTPSPTTRLAEASTAYSTALEVLERIFKLLPKSYAEHWPNVPVDLDVGRNAACIALQIAQDEYRAAINARLAELREAEAQAKPQAEDAH